MDFTGQLNEFIQRVTKKPSVDAAKECLNRCVRDQEWIENPHLYPHSKKQLQDPPIEKPDGYPALAFATLLRTHEQKFVCVESPFDILTDREEAHLWETLLVVHVEKDMVALQSRFTRSWVSVEPGGEVVCNKPHVEKSEAFRFELDQNGRVGLFSVAHSRYLCADENRRLVCNRPRKKDWELFSFDQPSKADVEQVVHAQLIPGVDALREMY